MEHLSEVYKTWALLGTFLLSPIVLCYLRRTCYSSRGKERLLAWEIGEMTNQTTRTFLGMVKPANCWLFGFSAGCSLGDMGFDLRPEIFREGKGRPIHVSN